MHATPRHSFCFPLYPVALYHFLACLFQLRPLICISLPISCFFWLGCMRLLNQSTLGWMCSLGLPTCIRIVFQTA